MPAFYAGLVFEEAFSKVSGGKNISCLKLRSKHHDTLDFRERFRKFMCHKLIMNINGLFTKKPIYNLKVINHAMTHKNHDTNSRPQKYA